MGGFEREKRQLEAEIEGLREALASTKGQLKPTQMQLPDPEQERLGELNEQLRENNQRLEQQINALSAPPKPEDTLPYGEYLEAY